MTPDPLAALAKEMRYHPTLQGKQGDYVDGWDAATTTFLELLDATRPSGDEALRAALDDAARELHRWHTAHRNDRITFEGCLSPYCHDARAAIDKAQPPATDDAERIAYYDLRDSL